MSTVPHRFRETSVKRFVPIIQEALSSFPQAVTIDPLGWHIAPTTMAARLRDAILAYQRYRYPAPWDRADFDEVASALVVAERDGMVYVGDRQSVRPQAVEAAPTLRPHVQVIELSTVFNNIADYPAVNVLGELAAKRALSGPLRLHMTDQFASFLEQNFDVSVAKDGPETFILT